ncbi:MAG: glycosyltransferase [Proteobacteria bacterium]|nr:glycosyltransferase [Pseudomonadota bacterium]
MPPDVMLPDGPVLDFWVDRSSLPPVSERDWPGLPGLPDLPDLREAALKHEIARLVRERNRLLDEGRNTPPAAILPGHHAAEDARRLAAKDRLIRALYASRSWRLAAPLRALSGLLGQPAAPPVERAIAETDAVSRGVAAAADELRCAVSVRQRPLGRSRGEVLVVAPHLPLFDRQAGGLRLATIVGLIAAMGWTVVFATALPAENGPGLLASAEGQVAYEQALRAAGVSRFVYGVEAIRAFLIEAGGQMRYAFLSFPDVALEVMPLIRAHCPWARVIFDTVDLHFLRMQREADLRRDHRLGLAAQTLRQTELACLRSADVTLAVSDEERGVLLDLAPEAVVETLPCVFKVPAGLPPGPEARDGLLFLGGFWHTPNGDAVLWFAEQVWPRIRARLPGLVFRIAGADPTPEVMALGRLPGIEVLGYVADLAPLFDAARVFVAPLRYGAGMKGKVGQSLIHGLPVVTTPIGAEGMALADDEHLLLAETAEDFAAAVLRLCADDALWRRLQARGRAEIEATLSTTVVARRLEALFRV